jgi:hypothetical protein
MPFSYGVYLMLWIIPDQKKRSVNDYSVQPFHVGHGKRIKIVEYVQFPVHYRLLNIGAEFVHRDHVVPSVAIAPRCACEHVSPALPLKPRKKTDYIQKLAAVTLQSPAGMVKMAAGK